MFVLRAVHLISASVNPSLANPNSDAHSEHRLWDEGQGSPRRVCLHVGKSNFIAGSHRVRYVL